MRRSSHYFFFLTKKEDTRKILGANVLFLKIFFFETFFPVQWLRDERKVHRRSHSMKKCGLSYRSLSERESICFLKKKREFRDQNWASNGWQKKTKQNKTKETEMNLSASPTLLEERRGPRMPGMPEQIPRKRRPITWRLSFSVSFFFSRGFTHGSTWRPEKDPRPIKQPPSTHTHTHTHTEHISEKRKR